MQVLKTQKNIEYKMMATYCSIAHIKNSAFKVVFYNENIEKKDFADLTIQIGRSKDELFYKNEFLEYGEKHKFARFIADKLKAMQILEIDCYFN